ncbi:MAG: hypothetical protein AAF802_10965 [Planctomycetota bacterium]
MAHFPGQAVWRVAHRCPERHSNPTVIYVTEMQSSMQIGAGKEASELSYRLRGLLG